jgi:hypothetical protein
LLWFCFLNLVIAFF